MGLIIKYFTYLIIYYNILFVLSDFIRIEINLSFNRYYSLDSVEVYNINLYVLAPESHSYTL
jgi:hypothetical protein